MASITCQCTEKFQVKPESSSGISAKLSTSPAMLMCKTPIAAASIKKPHILRERNGSATISAVAQVYPKPTVNYALKPKLSAVGEIKPGLTLIANPVLNLKSQSSISIPYTDKFAGDFFDFGCSAGSRSSASGYNTLCSGVQKLYPIRDVDISLSGNFFRNRDHTTSGLFQSVDDGIFTGAYHTPFGVSARISDDSTTFIQPSSIQTEGGFRYKCEVTKPTVTGKETRLYIRASAPLENISSKNAPQYTFTNVKLEDPSGNLIVKYKDLSFRGDADYLDYDSESKNFGTYGLAPEVNNLSLNTWHSDYPIMGEASGYTLNIDVSIKSLHDPFDYGFDRGYDDKDSDSLASHSNTNSDSDYLALDGAPLSTQDQSRFLGLNPTNTIRISAIEVVNSGGFDTAYDRYLNMFLDVPATGTRITRCLKPVYMPAYGFDSGVYPAVSSVWTNTGGHYTNQSGIGSQILVDQLNGESKHITLQSTGPVADSGKLFVKFAHQKPDSEIATRNGGFGVGHSKSEFNVGYREEYDPVDSFFLVESAYLNVRAKKQSGSRDYALDVVGWSDDKLLSVSSPVGGFLQNTTGSGDQYSLTASSGYATTNELALGGETLSDKHQFFKSSGTNNAGGDHYLLSAPLVSGTTFEWYKVPLKIYSDTVDLGKPVDYSQSSFFESLYLDIYPLPSGASISDMELCIDYKPSNALGMHMFAHESALMISKERSEGKVYPSSRQTKDEVINLGPEFSALSDIKNIPHAFRAPGSSGENTLKSNYSRRWKGLGGLSYGPYNVNHFGFGFERPLLDYPFVSGLYDFNYDDGLTINSKPIGTGFGTLSGTLTTSYDNYRFKNIGWRFSSGTLFQDQLQGFSAPYETTDWTAYSNGTRNFKSHELHGKIADAFDNVIRISGSNSYISFGDLDIADQFSMYIRFTPDANVSGASYNLFESGVLFSKWDTANNLEFGLGYSGGNLMAFAESAGGALYTARDTVAYSGYNYPLSVVMTHHNSSGLRLYTDNEISGSFTNLRASSDAFTLRTGNSDFIVGNSTGSGVGMNMFVSELGISNSGNLTQNSAQINQKQVQVSDFFGGNRVKFWASGETYGNDNYKLWDYVNEDTLDWDLGAFKFCAFGIGFNGFTKRAGADLISFNMKHYGSGYTQVSNMQLPSSINYSNVAYHTQIENDFLRFNLSDAGNTFYTAKQRITKDLPRGYQFSDRALVVETVLEHTTYDELKWSDGNVGPKLIVSLYTRNQDPKTYSKTNWGLINRATHYLPPSGCWERVDSTFNYNSMTDESEPWALFPHERRLTEFDHKYYSQDINDMFLQYDIVYPSGPPFESRLNVHSAHVRLEDALVYPSSINDSLSLIASGDKSTRENLNLYNKAGVIVGSGLNLHTTYDPNTLHNSGLILFSSGSVVILGTGSLGLHSFASVNFLSNSGLELFTSGDKRTDAKMNLVILNSQAKNIPGDIYLPLNTHGSSGDGLFSHMNLSLYNSNYSKSKGAGTENINLTTLAGAATSNRFPDGSMNLFIKRDFFDNNSMDLFLYGGENELVMSTGNANMLNLHTATYGKVNIAGGIGSQFMRWSNVNYGSTIDVDDNIYATLESNDEIRGVDLICYGACDVKGNVKCNEKPIYTHGVTWRPETCVDGGIFRALNTYTNLNTSGFKTSTGYSGHYYGIRKYTDLIPGMGYNVVMEGKTGSTANIELPREFEEWEYGTSEHVKYSGAKLIGDYPYLSGQKDISPPSGRTENDKFGSSVASMGDLMAVGAPHHEFDEKGGTSYFDSGNNRISWTGGSGMENAGAVFLYRRNSAPAGYDWDNSSSGNKAYWDLESKIVLPSAYRSDRRVDTTSKLSYGGLPELPIRKWFIGQRGRRFGHSVAVASSGDREILVVGGPNAKFERKFDSVITSGVNVGVMIFTDEFTFDKSKAAKVKANIEAMNFVYRYYAQPPIHIDFKVIICQPTGIATKPDKANDPQLPDWIHVRKIGRTSTDTRENLVSGIKEAFHMAFPYDTSRTHNNIPPVLGVYVDNSASLGRSDVAPAVDDFMGYYQNYSFLSGVKDFYGVQDSGYLYETKPKEGLSEKWEDMTNIIIRDTLDSGRLIANNNLRFLTSGVGIEHVNPELTEFNKTPPSGGRVYVFEKENNNWNLIQELKRPALDDESSSSDDEGAGGEQEFRDIEYDQDVYGHSVDISENSEVITVGSPYMEEACLIYEHDSSEKTRLYKNVGNWLGIKTDSRYVGLLEIYNSLLLSLVEKESAGKKLYLDYLTPSEKFEVRTSESFWGDKPISEYRKIFKYGYGNIPHQGTWQFIPGTFAPTSRLGYSTAISEHGDIAAFGAPTDSFNEFDDTNVYYKLNDDPKTTWADYVNAGAVRLFESRNYHPHSGVVEFYRFGNMDMTTRPVGTDHRYDDLKQIFETAQVTQGNSATGSQIGDSLSKTRPFRRTSFAENNIPKDAGLAFIITPEVDSASDEVIDNIKEWLAFGDRTLVLVGNDPVWEDDGKYESSNKIVNKILEKLDSRMRLHPARNLHESLPVCTDSGRPNAIPSMIPWGSRETSIQTPQMYAKGVADIRMYVPGVEIKSPCDEVNEICELPIKHEGDLRAQWSAECAVGSKCNAAWKYKTNWPWHFGSTPNGCIDCSTDTRLNIAPKQEPRPLLVAAEYVSGYTINYPATSSIKRTPIWKWRTTPPGPNKKIYNFDTDKIANVSSFSISGISPYGNFNSIDMAKWEDPYIYEGRDPLLQGVAKSKDIDPPEQSYPKVLEDSILCAEQQWKDTTSKVVMIGTLTAESITCMTDGLVANDDNIYFYQNLVQQSCTERGRVVQIGDWTKTWSFEHAYTGSILARMFASKGISYSESGSLDPDHEAYAGVSHNTTWIANPSGSPTEGDVKHIKDWLNKGDKTLVITYPNRMPRDVTDDNPSSWTDPSQLRARNVYNLATMLELDMKPAYLSGKQRYATTSDNFGSTNPKQIRNSGSIILKGCQLPNDVDTKVDYYQVEETISDLSDGPDFICLKIGGNSTKVVSYPNPVHDRFETPASPIWQIKPGIAKIKAPVIANSGYRVFYSWVSEFPDEQQENGITMYMDNAANFPSPIPPAKAPRDLDIFDYDKNDKMFLTGKAKLEVHLTPPAILGRVSRGYFDVRAFAGAEEVTFFFDGNHLRAGKTSSIKTAPKTTRFLSVSGALMPIIETIIVGKEGRERYQDGWTEEWIVEPGETFEVPPSMRPISTDNTKYCCCDLGELPSNGGCSGMGGHLIADGPVIAAEEPENFSAFLAGHKKSTIILLSDSSMIQGDCEHYRDPSKSATGESQEPNRDFIRSLYPDIYGTKNSAGDYSMVDGTSVNPEGGRNFSFLQKLIAPDRGSPHKYYSASGLSGLVSNFLGADYSKPAMTMFDDDENVHPNTVARPKDPETEEEKEAEKGRFRGKIAQYGAYPKFSGVVDGMTFGDPGPGGGLPEIMRRTGSDTIDFERFPSGHPGDLFGFDISMHDGRLVVGAPFNGFIKTPDWDTVKTTSPASGIEVSHNGGAGAAYFFERTGAGSSIMAENLPWEYITKIKPSSINVGWDNITVPSTGAAIIGSHSYKEADLAPWMSQTDKFGYSVDVHYDFAAIGAPGHDFENSHQHLYDRVNNGITYSGAFIRKEFGFQFDIPTHKVYDLGTSGVRNTLSGSGAVVLNNGAVFTYQNKISNWGNRTKSWSYSEKVVAQGHKSRQQKTYTGPSEVPVSGSENDNFGTAVSIDRARRTDGDYTLAVGAPKHKFATSGYHDSFQPMLDAGAAYTYDAMIREQIPSLPSSGNWINARLFGAASGNNLTIKITQNASGDPVKYQASGLIFSNSEGEIFLEASGQDPAIRGFIEHRSFIDLVHGGPIDGTGINDSLSLCTSGRIPLASSNMNLYTLGPDSAYVYNSMNLYTSAVVGFASGAMPSGLSLVLYNPSGSPAGLPWVGSSGSVPSGLVLFTSGGASSNEQLNLRVRGK